MSLSDIESQWDEALEYLLATWISDGNTRETRRLHSAVNDANDMWFETLMQER